MSLEYIKAGARRLRRLATPRAAAFDVTGYWDRHYAAGGTSGDGSYGLLGAFKSHVLSTFASANAITSCIDFGCGDGHVLGLVSWPRYIGLDVSVVAVTRCIDRYASDPTKSFFLYHPGCFADRWGMLHADVAVSLDVVYHVTDDRLYDLYMKDLCGAAQRFVVVYSTDYDFVASGRFRHRKVSAWMARHAPGFRLMNRVPSPSPGVGPGKSDSVFLLYERTEGVALHS